MKKLKSIKHVSLTYKLNIECVYKVLCLGEKYFLGGRQVFEYAHYFNLNICKKWPYFITGKSENHSKWHFNRET